MRRFGLLLLATILFALPLAARGQDRFESLPGYEQYQEVRRGGSFTEGGNIRDVLWSEDGSIVQFRRAGEYFHFEIESGEIRQIEEDERLTRAGDDDDDDDRRRRRRAPRGRQLTEEPSPDGQWMAVYREYNVYLEPRDEVDEDEEEDDDDGDDAEVEDDDDAGDDDSATSDDADTEAGPDAQRAQIAVTTEGNELVKYGTASWVYGEELDQNTAMWWSPDSSRLAFYEFDETGMGDYYLTPGFTDVHNRLYVERYPKAGDKNPVAKLLIYDLETRKTTRIDVGDDPEQYVYDIRFTPNGDLLFNRTNRHQNVLEVVKVAPDTGEGEVIITEAQLAWQENSPLMRFLDDGERFIWESERTGWKHYELRNLDGARLYQLTSGDYPVQSIVSLDEQSDWMYYTARSAEHPLSSQLHRVKLDGTENTRLTSTSLNYSSFTISPDHQHFIAEAEAIDTPPFFAVYDMEGNELARLAESDISPMEEAGITPAEMFSFQADDGETDIYGILYKPTDFDPENEYPLIVDVYGGPLSSRVRNSWRPANAYTEFGVLIAVIDNRGTRGRGKAFETATYLKLGSVDMKDQADGVRYLAQRPYVDGERVGITGHSYGGYMAALAVTKHPDVFDVAVAGAPVTDWRNYDTIYTERFMRTPAENPQGYDAGSCMTYVDQFEGKLLLLHGMVDDNVHPSNTFQLAHALQQERKPFDMMLFPNSGHGIGSPSIRPLTWEFLIENLVDTEG